MSGLITSGGLPARVVDRWKDGDYDLIASPAWLAELDEVVKRPKFAATIDLEDVARLRSLVVREADLFDDPPPQPGLTPDPKDDYLVALARAARCDLLVAGDAHLLGLVEPRPPVLSPQAFLALLDATGQRPR